MILCMGQHFVQELSFTNVCLSQFLVLATRAVSHCRCLNYCLSGGTLAVITISHFADASITRPVDEGWIFQQSPGILDLRYRREWPGRDNSPLLTENPPKVMSSAGIKLIMGSL